MLSDKIAENDMMKKLAVYANGWSYDAMSQAMAGIRKFAAKEDFDTFVFLSFASYSEHVSLSQGELNIYNLSVMDDYDGVIVFSTMLNSDETAVSLCQQAKQKGIPVVSIGMEIEGIPSISINNEEGMRGLVTHLLEKHDVKHVMFMGGTPDHVDSCARLEVTRTVMAEHGLVLPDEDVCYGEWGNLAPKKIVDEMMESGAPLPDAIICANDIMALATATELLRLGVKLPEDVIVTGFDNIRAGKYFYPALSSVKQNYEIVGQRACEMIMAQIRKEDFNIRERVHSSFVRGESCGCDMEQEFAAIRTLYCQRSYQRHIDSSEVELMERLIRQKISTILNYDALKLVLQDHYYHHHDYEGKTFSIVVHSEYFEDPMADEGVLWKKGIRDEMEVIVALKNGNLIPSTKVTRRDLVPGYEKKKGEQHIYYLLPMHYFQYNYGYVVFTDEPYLMKEDILYPYMEKLQQSMKLLRVNLRLDTLNKDLTRIYDKDPMTGLFNRFVYENKAIPLFDECLRKQSSMMVMFVDINYMKRINDKFGHLHGDNAIKTVAESIKANTQEDWIPVRYGGDEFLLIAPDCGKEEAEKVQQAILEYLDKKNHDGSQPYQISASCGYVVTDPLRKETLQEYVKEADKLMYEIKQKVHAKDGGARYE